MEVDLRQVPRNPLRDLREVVAIEGSQHGLDVDCQAPRPALERRKTPVSLHEFREVAGRAPDPVVPLAQMVHGQADREGLTVVPARFQSARDRLLGLLGNEGIGRHRDVRGVVSPVEEARDGRQVAV